MKKEKELREVYRKIIELVEPINQDYFGYPSGKSKYNFFCYIKLITAREKLKAGYLLTQNSLSREVLVFIRVMVEELAELKYVRKDKNLVDDWYEYDTYIRLRENRRQLQITRQNNKIIKRVEALQKKLEQEWLLNKNKFIRPSKGKEKFYNNWYCMPFEQLCQKVKMEKHYNIMFPYLSSAVHSSSRLVGQYTKGEGYFLKDKMVKKEFKDLYWSSMMRLFIEIAVFYFEDNIQHREVEKELKNYSHELKNLMDGDFVIN